MTKTMYVQELHNSLDDLKSKICLKNLADMTWRYEVGKLVYEVDAQLKKEGKTFVNSYKQMVTGVGTAVATHLNLNKSVISHYKALYVLFDWDEIRELIKHGYGWSVFRMVLYTDPKKKNELIGVLLSLDATQKESSIRKYLRALGLIKPVRK